MNPWEARAKATSDEFGNPISPEQMDAIQREIIETEQDLKAMQEQALLSNQALANIGDVGDKLEKVGSTLEGIGEGMTKFVTAPILAAGAAALKTTADFDEAMSKVKAISGATGEQFDDLRDKAREMGATTKFSASEAAEGLNYMAMAGWETDDMLVGIEGVMSLAAASGEDLATVSDIVTDAMTAFGWEADRAGDFADILATASANANTNVSMLGESFKMCAPLASAMGYSVEDTTAALALMANAGVKGTQAGTALRSVLTRLADPPKAAKAAMEEYGISLTDSEGNAKSLVQVLMDLRTAYQSVGDMSEETAAQIIAASEDETEAVKQSVDEQVAAAKAAYDAKYTAAKRAYEREYDAAKDAYDKQYNALKKQLDNQVKALQKSMDAEYNARKKAYDKAYDARKKALDAEYDALKDSLDEQYDAEKERLDKAYDAAKTAYSKQLEALKDAQQKEVDALKSAYDAKVALIDKEYSRVITIPNTTQYSMVELQPSIAAIRGFKQAGVDAMWVENDNGVLTVYTLGAVPTTAMEIQCIITEVGNTSSVSEEPAIAVDGALSPTSQNPVQNRAIYAALQEKESKDNKVTTINAISTDNDYPSAKAVWELFSSIVDGDSRNY